MRLMIFDGNPQEIQEAMRIGLIPAQQAPAQAGPSPRVEEGNGLATADREGPTPAMYRQVCTRKAASERQKKLLRVVYDAHDWLSKDEIAERSGLEPDSIMGVSGGLGLRCKGVRGWPRHSQTGIRPTRWLWDQETRSDGETYFKINPRFKQAITETDFLAD